MLEQEILRTIKRLKEYDQLNPDRRVRGIVKAGVNVITKQLENERDILITSPPYLQSQEYMRQAKLDLFWLGFSEDEIKKLSRMEIPYCEVEPYEIKSKTYHYYESSIQEPHIKKVFNRYFWAVLRSMSELQKKITSFMFIFVGHTSTRGKSIPIDKIFAEHLTTLGWRHDLTLKDTIVSRRLFSYQFNPATGLKDSRTAVENLIILRR